eukprot:CAMPEP_0170143472 /NCGR_PEP_ID=MMETSP0033_2-20121228/11205_1 /TAXON_ID=195969 /ORGANISM="Dolichomastix tenuilepis, Strain CCMP3274" /LENGTH=125 /DNA_ID=CAMNT_0010379921 /DNA_START=14 /DNA_END=388 /DNA_ORIENTATION=-
MAWGRIIANLVVMGGGIFARAATAAYRQAIINGQKAGLNNPEAVRNAMRGRSGLMSVEEAQMILGVGPKAPLEEVLKRYNHMYEINEKSGSFYLQSKVFRAKERLELELGGSGDGRGFAASGVEE